ncbi:MAG: peptidoglycan-binding domain-containing protein [Pseudomonadota bacterium]
MALTSTSVFAEDEVGSCGLPVIREAFKAYRQTVDKAQVEKIQTRLQELKHDPKWVDGIIGPDTEQALRDFCLTQNLAASNDTIAETLVELLFQTPAPASDPKTLPVAPLPAPQATAPVNELFGTGTAVFYRLSDQDFTELEARGAILQQLETLKDVEYLTEYALKTEVEKTLAELTRLADQYAVSVVETAQQLLSYRLTEPSFDRLRLANVPEAALELLQTIKNLPFPSKAALSKAVAFRLEQEAKPTESDASEEQSEANEPTPPNYAKYSKQISAQADEVSVYQLTDDSFKILSERAEFQVIPAALLEMIGKLKDVEYIDRQQFIQAIDGTIEIQNRYYLGMIAEETADTYRISQVSLNNLKAKGLPDYIVETIKPLQDRPFANREALKMAVQALLSKLQASFKEKGFDLMLSQQARRIVPEDLSAVPIRWDGGSCGCSRELSGVVVYGFYPFWLADQVEAPEGDDPAVGGKQKLDFSALTRIGYYGLYLDEDGEIAQLRQWSNDENALGFVKQARRYRTALDLVVYTDVWHTWSDDAMNKAAKKVAEKLNLQLPPSSVDRLKSLLPFTKKTRATMGDGVTIYFEDYTNPAKAEGRKKIASFMQRLHQELQKNPKPLSLNIMINLDWNELGEQGGIFKELSEPPELLGIHKALSEQPAPAGTQETDKASIDLILVLLEEPTTDSKKKLRSKIENEFKGKDRRIVLRKIIPIISPSGQDRDLEKKYAQFDDDLVYFEDNFDGVGLWPLPLAQNADVEELNKRIVEAFKPKVKQDFMERMVDQYIPQVCNYACPNRWQFRILFDILAFVLILVVVISLSSCRISERIKGNPWPVLGLLAALLLVFGTSLVCDPFWNQKSDDVAIGLLATIFIYGLWRYIRKLNQGKMP